MRRLSSLVVPLLLALGVVAVPAAEAAPQRPAGQRTGQRAAAAPSPTSYVARSGSSFTVDGQPWRFVGFNLYDAAATDRYSCNPSTRLDDAGLDRAFAQVAEAGGTVVRFWATQPFTAGGTDWSGVDRVIAAAKRYGLRVLPALEDGPANCSTGPQRVTLAQAWNGRWYSTGYRYRLGTAQLSYRRYAALVARHYRNEPTVMGWMMVNEAETDERMVDGTTTLVGFARDMAAVLHAAAPRHLVTLGTQGNGAPGTSGPDFIDVYSLAGLDFSEVHDWGYYGADDQAMPGANDDGTLPAYDAPRCVSRRAPIACAFSINPGLRKPIVVGEAGIASSSGLDTRAAQIDAKMSAAFAAGADGYLIWQLNVVDTDTYGVLVGSGDPVFDVLRRWSARLG